jgi:hypothetical protein
VGPGTYTLEVHDESKCLAATKTYIVGQRNNIVIDETNLKIKPASCNAKDGSVTGLNITNAVQYQWLTATKRQVGTTPDLTNVENGLYTLMLTSADGCTTTKTYEVPGTGHFPQPVHIDTIPGTCNSSPGTIILTFNPSPSDPAYNYYGETASGAQIFSGVLQYGDGTPVKVAVPIADADSPVTLLLIDPKDCSNIVGQYSLPNPAFCYTGRPVFFGKK